MTNEKILSQIDALQAKIRKSEGQAVVLVLEQAQLLFQLRESTPKGWQKELKKINFDPRVARRLVGIGRRWPDEERTPESALLAQLPYDPLKLEWLSKLSPDNLEGLATDHDFCAMSRSEVVRMVKDQLGIKPSASTSVTLESAMSGWTRSLARIKEIINHLPVNDRVGFIGNILKSLAGLTDSQNPDDHTEDVTENDEPSKKPKKRRKSTAA